MRFVRVFTGLITVMVFMNIAVAQNAIPAPNSQVCAGSTLVNCGGAPSNLIRDNIQEVLSWMINIAAALTIFFVVWSGFNMVIAMGDEGKISEYRWKVLYALLGLVLAISAQVIVAFVGTTNMGQAGDASAVLGNVFSAAIGSLRTILNIAIVLVLIASGIRMVYAQGKADEFNRGRSGIFWAIVGAIVVNLGSALIRAVVNYFPGV